MSDRVRDTSKLLGVLATGSPSQLADALNKVASRQSELSPSQREQVARAARAGLTSTESAVRGQSVFAIGELGDESGVLERALTDPDWFVRLAAVSALARLQAPIRMEAIARLQSDPEPLVRDAVRSIMQGDVSDVAPKAKGLPMLEAATECLEKIASMALAGGHVGRMAIERA